MPTITPFGHGVVSAGHLPPKAILVLSGLQLKERTGGDGCSENVFSNDQLVTFQICTLPMSNRFVGLGDVSAPMLAILVPSGLQAKKYSRSWLFKRTV